MIIYQTQFLSEIEAGHKGPEIPASKRVYFQARLKNKLFSFLLDKFSEQQKLGLTRADLARRIGCSDVEVNRLLGTPDNLTIESMSDLLLGICGEEFVPQSKSVIPPTAR